MSKQWTAKKIEATPWFKELQQCVQAEMDLATMSLTERQPEIEREIAELRKQQRGWAQSLAKPDLHPDVRELVEAELAAAGQLIRELENTLSSLQATGNQAVAIVDSEAVADRLNRLAEVLATENPSRLNIELSRHLDAIRCHSDGRVVVRSAKIGALALDTLGTGPFSGAAPPAPNDTGSLAGRPRKRAVRALESEDAGPELREVAHWSSNVNRFGSIDDAWFWEDEFHIPEPTCWSKEHAAEVAELRKQGLTHEELAAEFQVTVPTVRKSLRYAAEVDDTLSTLPKRMPRARWQDEHYREVSELRDQNWTVPQMCEKFQVSEPLIYAALAIAKVANSSESLPAANDADAPE